MKILIRTLALAALVVTAGIASAATGEINVQPVKAFADSFIRILNGVIVPLIFAIAFIVFIWGIFMYFIAGGADEEKRKQGRDLALWGVIAFVVMTSVWGIVNIVRDSFDFGGKNRPELPGFGSPANTNPSN